MQQYCFIVSFIAPQSAPSSKGHKWSFNEHFAESKRSVCDPHFCHLKALQSLAKTSYNSWPTKWCLCEWQTMAYSCETTFTIQNSDMGTEGYFCGCLSQLTFSHLSNFHDYISSWVSRSSQSVCYFLIIILTLTCFLFFISVILFSS